MKLFSVWVIKPKLRFQWIWLSLVVTIFPRISVAEFGFSANLGLSYILEPRAGTFDYQVWTPRLGIESYYTFRKNIEVGFFYDQNILLGKVTDNGSIHFFGALATIRTTLDPEDSNLFFYGKGGATQMVTSSRTSDYHFGVEVGIKYEIPINSYLAARGLLGVAILPSNLVSHDFHMVDSGLFLVVKL